MIRINPVNVPLQGNTQSSGLPNSKAVYDFGMPPLPPPSPVFYWFLPDGTVIPPPSSSQSQ